MFIIYLLVAVNCGMTLVRESLSDETEQFHITLTGITKTGQCSMKVVAGQVNLDFYTPVTSTFGINFISGGGTYTVMQMNSAQAYLQLNSCPSSMEFIIGPYQIVHLQAQAIVQVKFTTTTTQSFKTYIDYYSSDSKDVRISSNSTLTSDIYATLQLQYTPLRALTGNEVVSVILPYRDALATSPTISYFQLSIVNCDAYIDGVQFEQVFCVFKDNTIKVTNLVGSSTITLTFYGFQNPQSVAPVNDIGFQLTQFYTSTDYVIENLSLHTLQLSTPSPIVYTGVLLSDMQIGSSCDLKFVIQYSDFLYLGTTMTITLPNNFLFSPFTITMNTQLRQDFTFTFDGTILVIDNFILNEGNQNSIIFVISGTNPKVYQNYNNLIVAFSYNGDQIAYSEPLQITLSPQTFKQFTMINQNKIVQEPTEYCFYFELENPIDTNSLIQINFYTDVVFNSPQLTQIQNMNSGAQLQNSGNTIEINNAFSTTQQDQQISFCLSSISNPYFIDSALQNYDFNILLNDFPQVQNDNSLFIDLKVGDLTIISINQSQDVTNTQNNVITIVMQTHSGLAQNDVILVTFDDSEYDFYITFLNNNVITCTVQQQISSCKLLTNQIQIRSSFSIQPGAIITILIQNFITNRSVNGGNSLSIITLHKIFQIDQTNQPSYLSASQPNTLSKLSATINEQGDLDISVKYIYNLLATDVTYINVNYDCSQCECISDNCVIANNMITINSAFLTNDLYTFTLSNQTFTKIPSVSLRAVDQQGFTIYEEKTKDQKIVYQFVLFELTPANTTIGLSNIYTLTFSPNVTINAQDSVKLQLYNDYSLQQLQCNSQCTYINTTISLNQNRIINSLEKATVYLENITNPMSPTQQYYYSLSHFDNTGTLLQQSILKAPNFRCLFDNCEICQTSQCQKCIYPYLKVEGNCLLNCPRNYIIVDGSCQQCQAGKHCRLCSTLNLQQCIECMTGYEQIDGQCISIDVYNQTIDYNNNTASTPNNSTSTILDTKHTSYSIGLLNYFQFGVFGSLLLYKLMRKETQLFFAFSIFLGFSVPVFRIFSFFAFISDGLLLFANYSGILIGISAYQSIYFQFKVNLPLRYDKEYRSKLEKQNNFYLLDILFQHLDFRIVCCLRSQLRKSNFFNYSFENHGIIKDAVQKNYKMLVAIVNPLNFAFLLTAILITTTNNYQFEFLIFTSLEWLANLVVLKQLKQF